MKFKTITILLLSAVLFAGCGGDYAEYLKQAEELVQAGDKESAKKFFEKAADKGSPEAHFALAYRYRVPREEGIYHFSEAAKKGHGKALGYALEYLLFRADSLEYADPKGALALYYKAKKANPDLDLYDEENKLRIMKMCAEAGDFDSEAFCKKYDIQPHSNETLYHVWQIAEEASRGGRFGKPDPELVFQIVIRGGWVPAEVQYAVEETYKNWKNGEVKEFNICDYITSGAG
ncbi:MAG: sel1 repeat family protein, partial [Bdellovibrionales bacterium]|nr:sel1 repeat family protein [Bdellovibrionales bacterium]